MNPQRNYYLILGVSRHATPDEIKRAYRRLAKEFHPDVNPSPYAEARFKEINEAYQALGDPTQRFFYDSARARMRQRPGYSAPPPPPSPRRDSAGRGSSRAGSTGGTRYYPPPPRPSTRPQPPRGATDRGKGPVAVGPIIILMYFVVMLFGRMVPVVPDALQELVGQMPTPAGVVPTSATARVSSPTQTIPVTEEPRPGRTTMPNTAQEVSLTLSVMNAATSTLTQASRLGVWTVYSLNEVTYAAVVFPEADQAGLSFDVSMPDSEQDSLSFNSVEGLGADLSPVDRPSADKSEVLHVAQRADFVWTTEHPYFGVLYYFDATPISAPGVRRLRFESPVDGAGDFRNWIIAVVVPPGSLILDIAPRDLYGSEVNGWWVRYFQVKPDVGEETLNLEIAPSLQQPSSEPPSIELVAAGR